MKKLNFSELKVGLKVQDQNGNTGKIVNCKQKNNIVVKFDKLGSGGYGFYCIDKKANPDQYDPLYAIA